MTNMDAAQIEEEEPLMSMKPPTPTSPPAPVKKQSSSAFCSQLKFSFVVVLALFFLAVHELPIEGSFFHKLGLVKKFVHGDLVKEVDLQKSKSETMKKELDDLQSQQRKLHTEGSMNQATSEELEVTLKRSQDLEETATKRVAQLEKQVQEQEAVDAKLEQRLQELEQRNEELENESAGLEKKSGKIGAVEAELEKARQKETRMYESLHRIKETEINLLRGTAANVNTRGGDDQDF
eukprot:gnl/MRDRNA2_/MRDRNA2_89941_c0_seq1.p1 gnl/MRDRNA2_/MRDRNA2_89941_c0~~gnl/MRDRNA2_/MRDRNA2_89941_c0_seq1.p1  ORF type:complete len:236 (+),score=77.05 gnl/MRDRNA2_/MRDRNA2_89941_c0_seq1:116-823(+)